MAASGLRQPLSPHGSAWKRIPTFQSRFGKRFASARKEHMFHGNLKLAFWPRQHPRARLHACPHIRTASSIGSGSPKSNNRGILASNHSFKPTPLRSSKTWQVELAMFCFHYAARLNSSVRAHTDYPYAFKTSHNDGSSPGAPRHWGAGISFHF